MSTPTPLAAARLDWLREQDGFILQTKPEERSGQEREWLIWSQRRIRTLEQEVKP